MQGLKHLWSRSVWLLSAGILILLLASLGLLLYSSWKHSAELEPIQRHLGYFAAIETVETSLRSLMQDYLEDGRYYLNPGRLTEVRGQVAELMASDEALIQETPDNLRRVRQYLERFDGDSRYYLDEALVTLRTILTDEITGHGRLVVQVRQSVFRERRITLGLSLALLLVAVPLWLMVRRRIVLPLENLGYLMTLLSRRDYTPVTTHNIDPMLSPLFINYNRLVGRLLELEQEGQQREDSLHDAVHQATRMLLQQQRRLADAERLGAIGEVVASVAHELRNPLGSIQMALQNLARDIADQDHLERVEMILNETRRITRQLNLLLENARHEPERLQQVRIDQQLQELARLVRFQLHEAIDIQLEVREGETCFLPEAQFHQCLLNLMLNAAQILDKGPGCIRVRAAVEAGWLKLEVLDDGPGFPEEMLKGYIRSFGTFRSGGSGLGLVMVQRFATELGGNIRLANREPHGARVELNIPCESRDG